MNFDFETVRCMSTGAVPFAERAGVDLVEFERGRVKMKIPFQGNQNHIGIMYAGALFTLAEIPGGALFLTSFDVERFYPIVKSLNLRFLRPATGDIRVEARLGEATRTQLQRDAETTGKAEFTLELQLLDDNAAVVAESVGIYQLRRR